jgi:hypothetical protein
VIITACIGVDHMKYVLTQNQTARISGTIAAGTPYDGVYTVIQ